MVAMVMPQLGELAGDLDELVEALRAAMIDLSAGRVAWRPRQVRAAAVARPSSPPPTITNSLSSPAIKGMLVPVTAVPEAQ